MDEEDYWNKSEIKTFDFDDDHFETIQLTNDRKLFSDESTSEVSYDLPSNEIPLHLLISEADLRKVLEEQSMEETPLPKSITAEDELKLLRRKLKERTHSPSVSVTLSKLISKKPHYLHCFKSLEEKELLLDEAIRCGDGDAILTVTLYIRNSIKEQHFVKLLSIRPEVVNHYLNYLMQTRQMVRCTNLLTLLGQHNRLALLQYDIAMNSTNKKQMLTTVYRDYFNQPDINTYYQSCVSNYLSLLEWQQNENNSVSKSFQLEDKSVLEILYYASSMYKWSNSANNSPALSKYSPQKLMEMHKISSGQFEWVVLNERARSQAWPDLESLFEKKTWHNIKSKTFTINIPLDNVILQLYGLHAPIPVLNYFLAHISDTQHRLALSQRVGAEKCVIDSFVELKDKQKLETFIETITPGTDVRYYAENALKNLRSKWKSTTSVSSDSSKSTKN